MVNRIEFTMEQAMELTEEEEAVRTECDPSYRHGTYDTWVVPYEGKYFMFTVSVHHSEGWDDFDTTNAAEVKPVEVVTTEWRQV